MDDSLEIKKLDREMVVLLVEGELLKLSKEASVSAVESMGSNKKFVIPDTKACARRIISIVKEHSV
jgi:hypothetical protein